MPIKSVLDATNLGAENVMSKSHVDDHGSGTRSTARVGACLLIALTSACQEAPETSATARSADAPTLVVLMAVDQLRADLLDRYDTLFVGGFRRLLDDVYRFTSATHDHALTETAPGHTSLSTGVYPTRHGIVANTWSEFQDGAWRSVYSMEDLDRPVLGYPDLPGRSSANLNRRGLPDWIVSADQASRVVSISRKDRAAIGLAAKAEGEVYWLVDGGDGFVTSEFYHAELPTWLADFNATTMPLVYSDSVWESTIPAGARYLSRPDTSMFELDGEHSAFPHRPSDMGDATDARALNRWRYLYTPFPDRAVFSLAGEAIRQLQLGQRESLDYLGVSLSQTDLVGHFYGPLSREQLDNLLRLDRELERFFTLLDEAVGPGRWVLALSADHGVLDMPGHLVESGVDAAKLTAGDRRELRERVQAALEGAGADDDREEVAKAALLALPFVQNAYTYTEVEAGASVDSFGVLFARSFSRTRAAGPAARYGVHLRLRPNVLWGLGNLRTSHGSSYYYDRHVPMMFLGGAISAGVSNERVATVDVAPTLAWLTGTLAPDDLDGRVLESVQRR